MPSLVLVDLDLSTIWVGEVKTPFVLSLNLVAHCVGPASYTVEVVSHEQYEPAAGGTAVCRVDAQRRSLQGKELVLALGYHPQPKKVDVEAAASAPVVRVQRDRAALHAANGSPQCPHRSWVEPSEGLRTISFETKFLAA